MTHNEWAQMPHTRALRRALEEELNQAEVSLFGHCRVTSDASVRAAMERIDRLKRTLSSLGAKPEDERD